jgi:hypothetical protein
MNLIWIIGLALFVLAERMMPASLAFGRVTGLLLIAWGVWLGFTAIRAGCLVRFGAVPASRRHTPSGCLQDLR